MTPPSPFSSIHCLPGCLAAWLPGCLADQWLRNGDNLVYLFYIICIYIYIYMCVLYHDMSLSHYIYIYIYTYLFTDVYIIHLYCPSAASKHPDSSPHAMWPDTCQAMSSPCASVSRHAVLWLTSHCKGVSSAGPPPHPVCFWRLDPRHLTAITVALKADCSGLLALNQGARTRAGVGVGATTPSPTYFVVPAACAVGVAGPAGALELSQS